MPITDASGRAGAPVAATAARRPRARSRAAVRPPRATRRVVTPARYAASERDAPRQYWQMDFLYQGNLITNIILRKQLEDETRRRSRSTTSSSTRSTTTTSSSTTPRPPEIASCVLTQPSWKDENRTKSPRNRHERGAKTADAIRRLRDSRRADRRRKGPGSVSQYWDWVRQAPALLFREGSSRLRTATRCNALRRSQGRQRQPSRHPSCRASRCSRGSW